MRQTQAEIVQTKLICLKLTNYIHLYYVHFRPVFFTNNLQDRNERFIPQLMELLENAVTVDEDALGNIVIIRPEGFYILVNQDGKIHHSNDVEKW